jgi:secreted PhoX family phosphatase
MTKDLVDIEIAAHGGSVIEIRKVNGKWQVVPDSRYNRRITGETEMEITGPAAGHDRMKVSYDPAGRKVRGMLNNCGRRHDPWGTWLTAKRTSTATTGARSRTITARPPNYKRMGIPGNCTPGVSTTTASTSPKDANEAKRFGWVVEIDPFDPAYVPKKRTRWAASSTRARPGIVNQDGRYVSLPGDDERYDYVYSS